MRKLLPVLLLVFFITPIAAEVQHTMEVDESQVWKNTTVSLECDSSCPGLTWTLNTGENVLGVRDSGGELDYSISGDTLSIPGRRFTDQDTRLVEIRSRFDREAEEIHSGLYKRTLRLSGFSGKQTSGTVRSRNLLSGWTGYGFEESFSSGEMRFQGSGPVNLRVKFGDGYDTRYFSFFGSQFTEAEVAYETAIGTTGKVQGFKRFPVAVMDDATYDRKVNEWSAGEYLSGAIQIRSPEAIESQFIPVLAHEVVHGLNDRLLDWDRTRSSYIDEGTGKYVEFLVQRKLYNEEEIDRPPAELFGEQVRYDPDPSDRKYYTISSKGDPDVLWSYYQEDRGFMKTWSAMESRQEVRSFGYAYSELIVRNYVARMDGSLRELYEKLEVDKKVSDPDVKWQIYSQSMDMTPCDYDSRERFEQCLDTINEYDYPVYSATPERDSGQLNITRLEIPNRTTQESSSLAELSNGDLTFFQFLEGFWDYLVSGLDSVFK